MNDLLPKQITYCFLTLALIFSLSVQAKNSMDTIALGSCAQEWKAQPVWKAILNDEPELFLYIGDNIYADANWINGKWQKTPVNDPSVFADTYAVLAKKEGFKTLRETIPIMATWDDHDYGANDAGKEFHLKKESQSAFLDFFGFAKDAPIRNQAGIYHSKILGDDNQRIQIIMLDTRYHRDSLVRNPSQQGGPYIPNTQSDKTILGEDQWQWLENQLKQPADVRLVVSSIQLIADEHGYESWGNFPHERTRFYNLIASTKANGIIILSGDRHLTELSKDISLSTPYPLWDFTSSGLTQDFSEVNEVNKYRVSSVHRTTNYGLIEINWQAKKAETIVKLMSKNVQGDILFEQRIRLGDLVVGQ